MERSQNGHGAVTEHIAPGARWSRGAVSLEMRMMFIS